MTGTDIGMTEGEFGMTGGSPREAAAFAAVTIFIYCSDDIHLLQ